MDDESATGTHRVTFLTPDGGEEVVETHANTEPVEHREAHGAPVPRG